MTVETVLQTLQKKYEGRMVDVFVPQSDKLMLYYDGRLAVRSEVKPSEAHNYYKAKMWVRAVYDNGDKYSGSAFAMELEYMATSFVLYMGME